MSPDELLDAALAAETLPPTLPGVRWPPTTPPWGLSGDRRAARSNPGDAGLVDHFRPAVISLYAGMTCLWAGRIDEAAAHAREALALTRRLGARAAEAHASCLCGDVALAGSAEDAAGYYREALALAGQLGMRPLVGHCHLGLGKLYHRTGKRSQAQEHLTTAMTMYREMGMTYWLEKAEAELTA
jgi:tetratricopeptide (TPR) repeat protein